MAELVESFMCCTCRAMFPRDQLKKIRDAEETGKSEQMQCEACLGFKNRVQYMARKSPSLRGALKPLSQEERRQWMVTNSKLVGEDLAKMMHQTCVQASLTKQSAEFKVDGQFVDFDEAEKQFKDKPEQWESIKLQAQTHRCPIRGVDMYWIPKFSMTLQTSEVDTEERKRKLESSAKMAAPKKMKNAAAVNVAPAIGEYQGNQPQQAQIQAQKVCLTDANKKRLESCIIRLETKQMEFTSQMAEAEQEKFKELIPQRLSKLCDDTSKVLDKTIASAKDVLAKKEAPKGDLKQLFDDIKGVSTTCSDLTAKMQGAMSLADM